MNDNFDPFAFTSQDDDAEILALFREWLAQSRAADEIGRNDPDRAKLIDRALGQCEETERQILALRGGPVGIAIKAFLNAKVEHSNWTPSFAQVRIDGRDAWTRSLLRDAAALVPEIAECAAAVVHEDAVLIEADMLIAWVMSVRPTRNGIETLRWALATIASTSAGTPRGQAIKARRAVEAVSS